MSCYNLPVQNTCPDANSFDAQCKYETKYPFKWINTPPKGSKLRAYYKDFQCIYDFNLTWKQYVDAQNKASSEKLTNLPAYPPFYAETITLNLIRTNNPVSLSFGDLAKKYDSISYETKADGQKFALFKTLTDGLAASIEFLLKRYNGKNICQMSARHQGDYRLDGSPKGFNDCNAGHAVRLIWVKNTSKKLNVSPTMNFDLNDKESLFALLYAMTSAENGSKLSKQTIEQGYNYYCTKNNIP